MSSENSKLPNADNNTVSADLAEHVLENRTFWDGYAVEWIAAGERAWAATDPSWGTWGITEAGLHLLPENMSGMQAIELGCGTAYISAWMTRRGAEVVGIDNSSQQLETATRLMNKHAVGLTLLHGNAECVPYPDASFDFAISEYGAATWCDPLVWIAEAHRLLRPGGALTFIGNHPLTVICTPSSGDNCDERLHASYFGMHRRDWRGAEIDPGGIEFNLSISAWLRLFRATGFDVIDYHELQAPADTAEEPFAPVSAQWAHRWPSEQVWQLRKCPE